MGGDSNLEKQKRHWALGVKSLASILSSKIILEIVNSSSEKLKYI